MRSKENRHGKHNEDKLMFGGMVTPEFKALAMLTASRLKTTMMEVMARGIYHEATNAGVMINNRIRPEFKESIISMADILRCKRDNKRGKGQA